MYCYILRAKKDLKVKLPVLIFSSIATITADQTLNSNQVCKKKTRRYILGTAVKATKAD